MGRLITSVEDLTWLEWGWQRSTPGTAGTFYKAYSHFGGQKKRYYKLSLFDAAVGIVGHECVNELVADRLMTILAIPHLSYDLVHADISLGSRTYRTWLCISEDYKERGETKIAFEDFFEENSYPDESAADFFHRYGWGEYLWQMVAVDFLIINRDRHGANVEILRDKSKKSIRPAPLFDNGLSLLFNCKDEKSLSSFDWRADIPAQSVVGGSGRTLLRDNLHLLPVEGNIFKGTLSEKERTFLMEGLENVMDSLWREKVWETIWGRWCELEDFCRERRRRSFF